MERKFTRGLNKLGSAVQMRENVSQLVRESAVLVSSYYLVCAIIITAYPPFAHSPHVFTILFSFSELQLTCVCVCVCFAVGVSPAMHVTFVLFTLFFCVFFFFS